VVAGRVELEVKSAGAEVQKNHDVSLRGAGYVGVKERYGRNEWGHT